MSDISDQRRYYERMMDEIAAEHQKQFDQLKAENAKLLKELKAEHALAETLGHYHEHAQAENEKLRELVASVWQLFIEHGAVHPSDLPEVDAVRNDMRELGIEVDDG